MLTPLFFVSESAEISGSYWRAIYPTERMNNLGFLAFSPSCFFHISWKAFCWKDFSRKEFLWKYLVERRRNKSYTKFFSGSVLINSQINLWLVGRPSYVLTLHRTDRWCKTSRVFPNREVSTHVSNPKISTNCITAT